jgi:hypothetical protein
MTDQLRKSLDDNGSHPAQALAWPSAHRYILWFAAGLLLSVMAFVTTITLLAAAQRLPAPPVSGTNCIDEKLAWLKNNPDTFASNMVAVGSSVTWRNLDFSVLSPNALSALGGVVNAAPCYLRANQTRFMVEYLLQRKPEIHTVMTILSPRDMEVCSTTPSAFFEPKFVDAYFEGTIPDLWIYFRNLPAESFISDIVHLPSRRKVGLIFDRFGSGPLTLDKPDLWYPFTPEPSCYRELRNLAVDLRARNVQFLVVTFPVMPDWTRHHDPLAETQTSFLRDAQAALADTGAIFVDAQTNYRLPTSAFADPAHLQWPHVANFTRYIWDEARRAGARLPPLSDKTSGRMVLPQELGLVQ